MLRENNKNMPYHNNVAIIILQFVNHVFTNQQPRNHNGRLFQCVLTVKPKDLQCKSSTLKPLKRHVWTAPSICICNKSVKP